MRTALGLTSTDCGAAGSTFTRSAATTRRAFPSILTMKSSARRSSTGTPRASSAVTSTVIRSTPVRNRCGCCADGPADSATARIRHTDEYARDRMLWSSLVRSEAPSEHGDAEYREDHREDPTEPHLGHAHEQLPPEHSARDHADCRDEHPRPERNQIRVTREIDRN